MYQKRTTLKSFWCNKFKRSENLEVNYDGKCDFCWKCILLLLNFMSFQKQRTKVDLTFSGVRRELELVDLSVRSDLSAADFFVQND